MANELRARSLFVGSAGSLGERDRDRRWRDFTLRFPSLAEMKVIDLGGTVAYWERAPVMPRSLTILNVEADDAARPGISTVVGSACEPPPEITGQEFDLVYSNSAIEHVGGHAMRQLFAATVHRLASRHWIQTPYRHFPVEPHWVFPALQYLPLRLAAQLCFHWPLSPARPGNLAEMTDALLTVELLDRTQFSSYFPDSTIVSSRFAGLVKSLIAIKL